MKIYGNSKKFLIFSLAEILKHSNTKFCVAHPGITLTNMTSNFHKSINWIVKIGMKIFFHTPKKASKNITNAVFQNCGYLEWIGPRVFNVWGKPKVKKMKSISASEIKQIDDIANSIYQKLQ